MIEFDTEKIKFARELLLLKKKRKGIYSSVFKIFEDEITELLNIGLSYRAILDLLEKKLECELKYKTFVSWLRNKDKQKNQNSNTLRNNSQGKKEEIKKEVEQEPRQNNTTSTKKEDENDNPWWKKRVEELSKGMKEAGVRR